MQIHTLVFCCFLAVPVLSMPMQEGNKEEEGLPDTFTVACLAENWKEDDTKDNNMVRVGTCLKCLEEVTVDPLSEEGLPKITNCINTYMPRIKQDCARELADVKVNDLPSALTALGCFEESLENMGAEYCLSSTSSSDLVDKMTEGAGCILEMNKNVTDFVRSVKQKDTIQMPDNQGEPKDGMGKVMYLVTMAHCEVAADGEESRSDACKACFGQMFNMEAGKGGEDTSNGHAQLVEAARCSATYLMPYYQDCQAGMDSLLHVDPAQSKEKGMEVYKCYMGKLMRYVVSSCVVDPAMEATAENLLGVMDCSKKTVSSWAVKAAGPEMAAQVEQIFH